MSQEIVDWIDTAKNMVREYIADNSDVPSYAEVGFELEIAWTVNTPEMQKVLFRTSINDDERYMVTFDHSDGEVETTVKKITDSRMGPAI